MILNGIHGYGVGLMADSVHNRKADTGGEVSPV